MTSTERAFECDGDIDEFDQLVASGPALATAERARERTAALLERAESPHENVGIGALRLIAALATAVGDPGLEARTAVAKALREPDDDANVIEADAAARAAPELEERLAKKVPATRRAQAIQAVARARMSEGAASEAASLLERAIELADETTKPAIERELRAAWDAAGRSAEIEARVEIEAVSDRTSPAARADRWTEIAERRESRGDRAGAMRAQVEACKLDPEPLERWSALERLAEAAGDDATRVTALEAIAMRVGSRGRVAVFKRLARTHERRHDLEAAERAWQRVLALDPDDEEADHAVEAAIVERGRYDDLAEHLGRRADRLGAQTEKKEMLRAVRLRRAAILEQRLGRIDEACDELTRLLAEWPNSPGALRYLADLLERRGDYAHAAPLWQRAAALESDPDGRDELDLRAGRAALAAGDPIAALEHVARVPPSRSAHRSALELRAEVARLVGSDRDLGDALEALASVDEVDGGKKSEWLLEAAQAAARSGDSRSALERARRAPPAAPPSATPPPGPPATPQLLARALEYRLRGAGAPDEARHTIDELGRVRESIEGPDAALRAFLVAEALDVVQGRGAGMRELETARGQIGDHPLLGLGLAERLASVGESSAAVDMYRIALRGSLLDLRRAGSVALHAADAALRADRDQDAAHFLDLAQTDPDTREQTQALRARLIERATPPPAPVATASLEADHRIEEMEAAVRAAVTPVARASSRLSLARVRIERGDMAGAEPLLWEALADGLIEAGDALAPILSSTPDRVRDVIRLRRQQVALEPGDVGRLELLRAAALADDDRVYARAVEHVLRAFDPGAGPLPPPPLSTQPEQPGIFALLTRPSRDASGEALASLWEGATHLFARDPSVYGVTGLDRVVPGPTSVVARLYEMALRLLDVPRIPLYLMPSEAPPSAQVALLTSPSVLLAGGVHEDTSGLRFALGWGLSGALSHNVLRLAVSPGEGMGLVEAMRAAFGPPEIGRRVDAHAARLAQSFWQTVPARTQRRLQELLGGGTFPDYADLIARSHHSGRRVGLFLAGDFAWAAHQLVAETAKGRAPLSLESLRSLCDELPDLGDLLRLAVSPEYAEARWHVVAPSSQRGMLSSGRYSLY
jgi:tetratricopeptide (TPR) repeat protein